MKNVEVVLSELHENQQKVYDERARFNVLSCGRRWGKSALAVNLLSEPALEGYPSGYFAPTYKLLKGTFDALLKDLEPIVKKKHDQQMLELITGGSIEFWSLDKANAGRSRKYKRVVVDEAAFVKDLWTAWTESIRPTLTDYKGDAFFMSTPKGKNDFFKLFSRHKAGEPNWMSWQMSTYTNPFIDHEELEDAKRDLPELAFSQEYMAEFNDNIANPFGHAYIQQCIYPMSTGVAVSFGVDLAKSHDWTVIIGIDRNGSVCYFDRFQADWRTTTKKILDLPQNTRVLIDSTGVGDPIAEDVARIRGNVELFKFTSTSKQQIMEGLAVAIQKRVITFPEGAIKDELENFEFQYTRSGVRYAAPEGMHDDCVCALAMAWKGYGQKTGSSFSFI